MNRTEYIILAFIAIILIIMVIKSKWFDRFLNWLVGAQPTDASSFKREANSLKKDAETFKANLEKAKQDLKKEQEEINNIN